MATDPGSVLGRNTQFGISATSTDSLWRVCVRDKQFFAARSTDGGARWSDQRLPFIPLFAFQPVSGQVAWSQDVHGTIYRTADGGASWQPVWHSGGPARTIEPRVQPDPVGAEPRRRVAAGAADPRPHLARRGTALHKPDRLSHDRCRPQLAAERRQAPARLTPRCRKRSISGSGRSRPAMATGTDDGRDGRSRSPSRRTAGAQARGSTA